MTTRSILPTRLGRLALFSLSALVVSACGGSSGGGSITPPPGGGGGGGGGTPVATTSVTLRNSAFDPSSIAVAPGAVVTFTNADGINHNVTFSSAGIMSTGDFSGGAQTVLMPTAPGAYAYRCTLHSGMSGTVTVQ